MVIAGGNTSRRAAQSSKDNYYRHGRKDTRPEAEGAIEPRPAFKNRE